MDGHVSESSYFFAQQKRFKNLYELSERPIWKSYKIALEVSPRRQLRHFFSRAVHGHLLGGKTRK